MDAAEKLRRASASAKELALESGVVLSGWLDLVPARFFGLESVESILSEIYILADSSDWGVRERAGFALRNLAEEFFDQVMGLTDAWVSATSPNVRRAVCLACMQRKRFTNAHRVEMIMSRMSIIASDDDVYVRRCCGPFVLGYLGYTYPEQVLPWLAVAAGDSDLNVRANVAKAFTQALGRRFPEEGMIILRPLLLDSSRRVRLAAASAERLILRHQAL
jgi:hypothetical protein